MDIRTLAGDSAKKDIAFSLQEIQNDKLKIILITQLT
jgi:hypothetical protein